MLALVCVVGSLVAAVSALLFLVRADRFTRMIPTPVHAGFAIGITVLPLTSQGRALWQLSGNGHSAAMSISICAAAIVSIVAARYFRPRWPASAVELLAAAAIGMMWLAAGNRVDMVMQSSQPLLLPWSAPDSSVVVAPGVQTATLAQSLL